MQKIISLYKRDYEGTRLVYDEVVPGAEWVIGGEGYATEKLDGTACRIKKGALYKRYDAQKGKTPPDGFEPAQDPDPVTGHWPGWVAVSDKPEDKWHRAASIANLADGTYELLGPKVQNNPYRLKAHMLRRHGDNVLADVPRDYTGLKRWFAEHPEYEGVVWHHPHGGMVKIKRRDFGLPWPA